MIQFVSLGHPGEMVGNDGGEAISIMHGTYAWTDSADNPPVLSDITFSVPKGSLCIVVGAVGCGKSSLLAAMLGEMHCVSGSGTVQGSLAYTAQACTLCFRTW